MSEKKRFGLGQRITVTCCGLLLGFSIVLPASAYLSKTATDLAPWLESVGIDIDSYITDLKAIEKFYAQVTNGDIDEVLTGLEWALGEMGLPVAGEIPDKIESVVAQVAADLGIYTPNSQKLENVLMGEANKKYADAQAEIMLGQKGQQIIKDSLQGNAKIVADSSNAAQLAQGMTITQDIEKERARIEANSSVLLGSIYEESVLSRINATQGNQHAAVLAADVERKNWEQEVTKASNQAYVMRSTAQAFSYGLNPNTTSFP